MSVALYRFRSAELFAAPDAPPPQIKRPATPSPLARRLRAVMAEERAYRAEGFSIAALAARLGEPEYRIRRAINGEMGFRNFTAFLNSFRLDEVRAALSDPAQQGVPILTIAIDAGFGSLGPFNRAFRDAEGMTPSEYRAEQLIDSRSASRFSILRSRTSANLLGGGIPLEKDARMTLDFPPLAIACRRGPGMFVVDFSR